MMDRVRVLRRVLEPLRPYLEEVVLIGGWVPFLYLDRVGRETSQTSLSPETTPGSLETEPSGTT